MRRERLEEEAAEVARELDIGKDTLARARAELDRARAEQRWLAARQHLAALWGEKSPSFEIVATDPLRLPRIVDFVALAAALEATPELAQFADERRVRESRLQLARASSAADLETINFKVTPAFKKEFKGFAVSQGMTMLELLKEGFSLSKQKRKQ